MAQYQSIHTGLEIDEGITQVGVLTPIVTGNTEQINNINQALVTLDDTVTGNTEQISLRLKLDQTTPQTLTSSPKINDLVAGQMCYVDANKQLKPIDVFWDNVNKRMGIGVATPLRQLHIAGNEFLRIDREGIIGPSFILARTVSNVVQSSWLFGPAKNVAGINGDNFAIIDYGTDVGGTGGNARLVVNKTTGNISIGSLVGRSKLDVAGGIQCGDDTAAASADKVGTTRYRETANASYVEMCMKVGASSYSWITIVTNTW